MNPPPSAQGAASTAPLNPRPRGGSAGLAAQEQESPAAGNGTPASGAGELRRLLARFWPQLTLTYLLFNLENLLRLAQPILIGWAINGLLQDSYQGLAVFAAGHFTFLTLQSLRQMYDTRIFSRIYATRATEIALGQRQQGLPVSRVAARTSLARHFVDFFERHVPLIIRAVYSLIGALVILAFYDVRLVLSCLALTIPALIIYRVYGRQTLLLSRLLHNQMEREVHTVDSASEPRMQTHFGRVAKWQIRLSDAQAIATALMELFILLVMVTALIVFCTRPGVQAGDIFAAFRYVLLFIMALDSFPTLVEQTSRLRDIGRRLG